MKNTVTIKGIKYNRLPACDYGDYGGSGSVGHANIRYLKENHPNYHQISMGYMERYAESDSDYYSAKISGYKYPDYDDLIMEKPELVIEIGDYSSVCAWIRDDIDIENEYTASLENYPCLDEQIISEIEMEWESEAWDSWVKSDLMNGFNKSLSESLENETINQARYDWLESQAEKMESGAIFEAYRASMELTNTYPETEYAGVYIDIKRIQAAFNTALIAAIDYDPNQHTMGF